LKILYLITRAEAGGAQMHVLELMRGLKERAEIFLGSGEVGFLMDEASLLGVKTHHLHFLTTKLSPSHDFKAIDEARMLIRHVKPDIVHLHSSKAGIVGRLAAQREGVPFVFTAHGWAFTDGASWQRKLVAIPSEWVAACMGGHIICVSEYDYALALRHHITKSSRMTMVHNGLKDSSAWAQPDAQPLVSVIMVARFADPKDHALVVQAMSLIENKNWTLSLVGDGPLLQSCKAQADVLGVSNRVSFCGARSDVVKLLARSHIFVLASKYEGFPISILEAMRAGLPVVASDVGGVKEAVIDGMTGWLFSKGDVGMLASKLSALLQSPKMRADFGRAGRERFLREFTVERMIEKTEDVYRKVLGF
jgi:glycosyltransferase involved in cell wall biosynthesis